jgi:hypothetical protein
MPRWIWIFIATALAALLWAVQRPPAHSSNGGASSAAIACVMPTLAVGDEPVQIDVPASMQPFRRGEFVVSPLAAFSIEARVLGREDYRLGPESAISPTDLALGWRRMAQPEVYEPLGITQSGRWYRYRWGANGPPIPLPEIVRSSANMHMVPADESVARALDRVRPAQMVRIQGWLIEARRDDGWAWRSSLTRADSGDGACELVYVCSLTTL